MGIDESSPGNGLLLELIGKRRTGCREVSDEGDRGNGSGCRNGRDDAGEAARAAGSDKRRRCSGSCVGIRPDRDGVDLDLDRSRRPRPNTVDPRARAGRSGHRPRLRHDLAPLPGDVGFTVGASLPISGLTAWQGLFQHGRLQAGQSVLAHGAAGAVGSMVTQLAREAGAYVIGTGRGADRQKTLDFGAQEFVDLDHDVLEGVGEVDLVFDVIGGDIQKRSAGLIRAGGTLVSIVGPTEARPADGLAVDFVVESDRAQLSEIVQRVRDGRLRTNIGNVSTLDDAVAALNPTERRRGKTIIRVRP